MSVVEKQQRTRREWKQDFVAKNALLLILLGMSAVGTMIPLARASQRASSSSSRFPVDFEANNSPNSPVKYSARTVFYDLFISNEETDVVLHGEKMPPNELTRGKLIVVKAYASLVRMRFIDSNLPTAITPLDVRERSHPPYTAVVYRGIYPGTDVLLRAQQRKIAFQLNLSSGADPANIILQLAGITGMKLDKAGNTIVSVGHASFVLQRPVVRIRANVKRQLISGAFKIEHGNRLRFIVPDNRSANGQTVGD